MHNGMVKTVFVTQVLMLLELTVSVQVLFQTINAINATTSLILRWLMEPVYATMASISLWVSVFLYQLSTAQLLSFLLLAIQEQLPIRQINFVYLALMDVWVALLRQYVFNVDYSILITGLHIFAIRFVGMGKGLLSLAMMETTIMGTDAQLIAEYKQVILVMEVHQIAQITVLNFYLPKSY